MQEQAQYAIGLGTLSLINAGLAECVAETVPDYLQKAVTLCKDLPRLAAMRDGLRERLRVSALMDEVGVTGEVEAAFSAVWQTWCQKGRE